MKPALYHQYPPQDPGEFEALCRLVRETQPAELLEVGSRHGRSLVRLIEAALPGLEMATAIDLPGGPWGRDDSREALLALAVDLAARRIKLALHLASSYGPDMRALAATWGGRFDFIFLDGDHRLAGITADFEIYWPTLAPGGIMAIHDISGRVARNRNGHTMEVPKFWQALEHPEISERLEFIAPDRKFGIGVLRKCERRERASAHLP